MPTLPMGNSVELLQLNLKTEVVVCQQRGLIKLVNKTFKHLFDFEKIYNRRPPPKTIIKMSGKFLEYGP